MGHVGGTDGFSPVCSSSVFQVTDSSNLAVHSWSAMILTVTQSDYIMKKGKRTTPFCTEFYRLGNR